MMFVPCDSDGFMGLRDDDFPGAIKRFRGGRGKSNKMGGFKKHPLKQVFNSVKGQDVVVSGRFLSYLRFSCVDIWVQ
jgi:hypothetical protein